MRKQDDAMIKVFKYFKQNHEIFHTCKGYATGSNRATFQSFAFARFSVARTFSNWDSYHKKIQSKKAVADNYNISSWAHLLASEGASRIFNKNLRTYQSCLYAILLRFFDSDKKSEGGRKPPPLDTTLLLDAFYIII